ncbi:hypothetical protein WHR41_05280 [Cladosporium halotolerans]|uniref:Uncharacterized protein n=1 Tax=Cladosporium halotolerans TaxID=1052096 RepID=A0AB34KN92_9PEZI
MGPIGDALGIISFLTELGEGSKGSISGTRLTIGVNREGDKDDDFYGRIRVVWGFDVYNNILGSSDMEIKLDQSREGASHDVLIHQVMGQEAQAAFIDIIASDDGICITHVTANFPEKGEPWTWTEDIGAACGQAWHYGSLQRGTTESGEPYFPKCTWIDTDGGVDIDKDPVPITNRQMKINLLAYGGDAAGKGLDYYCGATIFTHDNADPIAGPQTN